MGGDIERIGDYKVIGLLGAGGMGEVFLVEHPRLPRRDAVKLLDAAVSRNQEFRRRFQREAELLALQRHPNVVTVYDQGEHGGRLWLAMEYVEGQDCAQLLASRGRLPLSLVCDLVAGAAAALDYAYSEHRVTHRDVKPSNILVALGDDDALKVVKLVDFGIAKAAGESTSITSTGVTVGTMSYISPEAIEGGVLDNRSDLYSLSCTAFELLTGSPPYAGGSIAALMSGHLNQAPPAITERNRDLPAYLDCVFERALAKDPNARFGSCAELVDALRAGAMPSAEDYPAYADTVAAEFSREPTQRAELPAPAADRLAGGPALGSSSAPDRHWLLVVSSLIAVVVVVGGLVVFFTQDDHPAPRITEQAAVESPPEQTTLPFVGLNEPVAVVVDRGGNVYVADSENDRVMKLPAGGSGHQEVLPFPDLDGLRDVAVDGSGNVYTLDFRLVDDSGLQSGRVMMLAPDSGRPVTLPVSVRLPGSIAVDAAGNVYVAEFLPDTSVTMLAAGSKTQQQLPFTTGADGTNGLAVDASGNLYASTLVNARVVMWTAATGQQRVLPLTVSGPRGLAVDSLGAVYVADQRNSRVVKLDAGSGTQRVLPFAGLNGPAAVAIGAGGAVYVADRVNNRVVQLTSR